MVDTHKNEDPELQALKDWWAKYGTGVLTIAVVALGIYVSTQMWQRHTETKAMAAAEAWVPAEKAFVNGNAEEANTLAAAIRDQHAKSPYAIQAALWQAKLAVQAGDMPAAEGHLDWAVGQLDNKDPLKSVVQLRQARVLAEQQKYDAALAVLSADAGESFAPAFAEVRGDILLAQGNRDGARGAYAEALAGLQAGQGDKNTLQAKFDDLTVELTAESDA